MIEERLYVDIERCMAGACETGGLTPKMLERFAPRLEGARRAVLDSAGAGMLGWMDLPRQDPAEFLAFAEESAGRFECLLVIGIGGSALGTIALSTALLPFFHNELTPDERGSRPRLYVLDNVDPDESYERLAAAALAHGTLTPTATRAVTAADGEIECAGTDGRSFKVTFSLAPLQPERIQEYEVVARST